MKIGVIGDDFTGSSDIALTLAQAGMRTVQYVDVPKTPAHADVEAGVVSLKSRSCAVEKAVEDSVHALQWLKKQGCELIIFKYCSTFDSTKTGNIGPVMDALIAELDCKDPVIVCPAFPATGRTIYQGHLYVFDQLLSESGMQNHPITPMTDPDIRRWLQHQTLHNVGHLPLNTLRSGGAREHMLKELANQRQPIVCDAVDDNDLIELANATKGFALMTGGSGIAIGLPALFGIAPAKSTQWHGEKGKALALSGSCSSTTLSQISHHERSGGAHLAISIPDLLNGKVDVQEVVDWGLKQTALPLVSTSAAPEQVKKLQQDLGAEHTASNIENFFGDVAKLACSQGVSRLISAGGETSGAIIQALSIEAMNIGPMIDPGVPALRVSDRGLTIALKSGNFGAEDFFEKANNILKGA